VAIFVFLDHSEMKKSEEEWGGTGRKCRESKIDAKREKADGSKKKARTTVIDSSPPLIVSRPTTFLKYDDPRLYGR